MLVWVLQEQIPRCKNFVRRITCDRTWQGNWKGRESLQITVQVCGLQVKEKEGWVKVPYMTIKYKQVSKVLSRCLWAKPHRLPLCNLTEEDPVFQEWSCFSVPIAPAKSIIANVLVDFTEADAIAQSYSLCLEVCKLNSHGCCCGLNMYAPVKFLC